MELKALREFLMTCPLLSDRQINVNYLSHIEGSLSLEPVGEFRAIRTYFDGGRIIESDYCLGIRCAFDENTLLNIEDNAFFERVALWIEQQSVIGNLPSLNGGKKAIALRVKKQPHILESSHQGARMQLEFTMIYKEV